MVCNWRYDQSCLKLKKTTALIQLNSHWCSCMCSVQTELLDKDKTVNISRRVTGCRNLIQLSGACGQFTANWCIVMEPVLWINHMGQTAVVGARPR